MFDTAKSMSVGISARTIKSVDILVNRVDNIHDKGYTTQQFKSSGKSDTRKETR